VLGKDIPAWQMNKKNQASASSALPRRTTNAKKLEHRQRKT
jgi:hypothetical protein